VFEERNKDAWATQAFADCFVEMLREVNRKVPGTFGVWKLERFFELLRRGASVNLYSVTQAAVARINPTEDGCLAVDNQKNERLEALLRIA
jgi:hypothetical protein